MLEQLKRQLETKESYIAYLEALIVALHEQDPSVSLGVAMAKASTEAFEELRYGD